MSAAVALGFVLLLDPTSVRVDAGTHRVGIEAEELRVESRIVVQQAVDELRIAPLAAPLGASSRLDGVESVRDEEGRVTAIVVPKLRRDIAFTVHQPFDDAADADALPVPIPVGGGAHRVTTDADVYFTPDTDLGLVAQMGYHAAPSLPQHLRHLADDLADDQSAILGAFYLRDSDVADAGGLTGRVQLRASRQRRVAIAVFAAFGVIVLGLVFGYRRLMAKARVEEAERIIDEEFARLDAEDA